MNVIAVSKEVQMLRDLPESIARMDSLWKAWYDQDAPEREKIPEFEERVDRFEALLVVRALREDRTLLSAQDYIEHSLGKEYVDSYPLDLRAVSDEASAFTPIIALLSMGQAREQADRLGAEGALRPAPRPLDHGHAGVSRREQDGVLHVPVLQGAAADRPQLRDERRPARRGEPEQVGAARRGAADFDGVGGPRKLERPVTREVKPRTPCGIRTHDPWIRSPVPYPLGQWGVHPMWGSNPRPPV